MQLECPLCKRVLEFSGKRPAFCSSCGQSLAETGIDEAGGLSDASDILGEAPPMPVDVPEIVGEYRLVRELGEGGMGAVWEAEQTNSGRRVALKLLPPGQWHTQEMMDRFLQEGRLAAALSHPRSTFVFEVGEQDGMPYIVMELMPGQTLDDICKQEGPLPVKRAVDYILDVIEGLEAAHAVGVIHRDVKPSNCFLDSDGRVKVGDYGLSKSLLSAAHLTQTGVFMGTPLFASPEQVRAAPVDQRTDVYSVGATLFYLIAHRGPFEGDVMAVTAQIASDPAPSLSDLVDAVPRELDGIVARTLEKDPARRWANLAQLRQALLPFATGGTSIADVGRRMGAFMVDTFLIGIVTAFVWFVTVVVFSAVTVFGQSSSAEGEGERSIQIQLLSQLIGLAFGVGYFAFAEARWGRAFGKKLMGLRVIGLQGEPAGLRRTLLRSLVIPGGLGLPVAGSLYLFLRGAASPREVEVAGQLYSCRLR